MLKVGITGGIGSGKTLVCSILDAMQFPIFYADSEAKNITETNPAAIDGIKNLMGDSIYLQGKLDRKRVAQLCFSNPSLLEKLNNLIHPLVFSRFRQWVQEQGMHELLFMEAAILFESGADTFLDSVIGVWAPLRVRVQRVTKRDSTTPQAVMQRIQNQMPDDELLTRVNFVIKNDGTKLITPQVIDAVNYFSKTTH